MKDRKAEKYLTIGAFVVAGLFLIAGICASASVDYSGPPDVHCGVNSSTRHYSCEDESTSSAALKVLLFIHADNTKITSAALLWTARSIVLGLILAFVVGWIALLRHSKGSVKRRHLYRWRGRWLRRATKPRKTPLP